LVLTILPVIVRRVWNDRFARISSKPSSARCSSRPLPSFVFLLNEKSIEIEDPRDLRSGSDFKGLRGSVLPEERPRDHIADENTAIGDLNTPATRILLPVFF
jgi:hypothetical protein